jgi:hypothetical protein
MNFKKPNYLITVNRDAKTVKGVKEGVLTGVMYLAPHTLSGHQTCPKASDGCKAACLFTAGRNRMPTSKLAKINRTKWFFEKRDNFMATIVKEIDAIIRKAKRENLKPAIRLNGTSDIAWEKIKVTIDGTTHRNIMLAYPDIQFYDYTKVINRKSAIALDNYHLTFSLAEDNDDDASLALKQGYNLAVVMKVKRNDDLPKTWSGYNVINGDATDVRFNDGKGFVVGLRAKGDAIKDKSGFVRDIDGKLCDNDVLSLEVV